MARSIYITSAEGLTGKSTIALGVLDALMRVTPRVGVFRPIARSHVDQLDRADRLFQTQHPRIGAAERALPVIENLQSSRHLLPLPRGVVRNERPGGIVIP